MGEWYIYILLTPHSGAGAFASPLVATQFSTMEHWSFHYLVSLGLALINTAMLGFTFKWRDLDGTVLIKIRLSRG